MPFPTGWPPRTGSGIKNIRVYITGALAVAGDFSDNAYLFIDQVGANPYIPLPFVRPGDGVSSPSYSGPHVVPTNPAGTGEADEGAPKAMIWAETIYVINTGANPLEISFDDSDANVHGVVPAGQAREYRNRREAGIALRSALGTTFRVEAW